MAPVTDLLQSPIMLRSTMLVAAALLFFEARAAAYLDPGTGSMLLQALLGGAAAVGVIAKLYWRRVTAAINGRFQRAKR